MGARCDRRMGIPRLVALESGAEITQQGLLVRANPRPVVVAPVQAERRVH